MCEELDTFLGVSSLEVSVQYAPGRYAVESSRDVAQSYHYLSQPSHICDKTTDYDLFKRDSVSFIYLILHHNQYLVYHHWLFCPQHLQPFGPSSQELVECSEY